MLSVKDAAIVYETLLSSPGMNDSVKISLQLPRKSVLLLAKLIELGRTIHEDEKSSLLKALSESGAEGIHQFITQLLQKASLAEMYERMNALEAQG